jgi:hypothetical protein
MRIVDRSFDAETINRVINHPAVKPWVAGDIEGDLDVSPVLRNPRNFALFGRHGGIIFTWVQPCVYEAHTQVLPEGRGAWALQMANAALLWLFAGTDALEVLTRVPHGNRGARALAQAVHGVFEFTNARGFMLDGETVPADIYSLTIQTWMRTAPNLIERGHWFHDAVELEFERLGRARSDHPDDDDVHQRYAGAAVEMALAGQIYKAVALYNRWAAFAGYPGANVVSLDPPTVDISDCVLTIENGAIKVISCQ